MPGEQGFKAQVAGLLFVAGRPVALAEMERVLEVDRATLEGVLATLAREYQGRGLCLERRGDEVQMVSAPEVGPAIERFLRLDTPTRLSKAALETLAIVAYYQPITRAGIEARRGVSSDHVLAQLEARGLIAEVGRLPSVGHPILWGTTFEFLQYLGLSRLEELPALPPEAEPEG